jgi:large subunit ribosomal protein L10
MLTKEQKEQLAKDFIESIISSKTTVVVDYKGMTVGEISELRNLLREAGIRMQVLKKSIAQVAFDNQKIKLDVRKMEGQLAFVYGGDDEVSAPKIVHKFAKDNEKLKMLAGVLESKAMTQAEMVSLAKLPSKDELLAKVVGSLKAPVSGFVNVLGGNLRGLVYALRAIKDKKEV